MNMLICWYTITCVYIYIHTYVQNIFIYICVYVKNTYTCMNMYCIGVSIHICITLHIQDIHYITCVYMYVNIYYECIYANRIEVPIFPGPTEAHELEQKNQKSFPPRFWGHGRYREATANPTSLRERSTSGKWPVRKRFENPWGRPETRFVNLWNNFSGMTTHFWKLTNKAQKPNVSNRNVFFMGLWVHFQVPGWFSGVYTNAPCKTIWNSKNEGLVQMMFLFISGEFSKFQPWDFRKFAKSPEVFPGSPMKRLPGSKGEGSSSITFQRRGWTLGQRYPPLKGVPKPVITIPIYLLKLSVFTEYLVFDDQNGPFWDDHKNVKLVVCWMYEWMCISLTYDHVGWYDIKSLWYIITNPTNARNCDITSIFTQKKHNIHQHLNIVRWQSRQRLEHRGWPARPRPSRTDRISLRSPGVPLLGGPDPINSQPASQMPAMPKPTWIKSGNG